MVVQEGSYKILLVSEDPSLSPLEKHIAIEEIVRTVAMAYYKGVH